MAGFDDIVNGMLQQGPPPPPVTPAQPPPAAEPSFLSRTWGSLKDAADSLHAPGSSGPQPIAGLDPASGGLPIAEPELFAGLRRGARDVMDTGAEALAAGANKIPGVNVDVDALRQGNQDYRDAFDKQYGDSTSANVGRVAGQMVATAPVLGGVGGLVTRGAGVLPGAIGTGARFVTGSTPAATTIGRGAQLATQGAATGATQAALTSSASDQPIGDQIATGAVVGGVGGPVLGGLTRAVDTLRGFSGGVRPEIAALADQARQMGINVPLTGLSDNPTMKIALDALRKLPLSGNDAARLEAQRAAQSVVAGEMGSAANTFGPAEMNATASRLSQGYKTALGQVPSISGGAPLATDLTSIANDAGQFTDPATVSYVGRAIKQVSDLFPGGQPATSQAYMALTNSDGALAKIEAAAPSAAQPYLDRVRQALKDRMIASGPPGIANDIANLDAQWRAMKTIQPLAAKSTLGDIQLGGLQQQVINQSNRFDPSIGGVAYTGGGTLGKVGDIGKQFFGSLPESGTAPREQAYEFAKHPLAASVAAIPGLISRPLQSYLRSPTVTGRVIDTSLGGAVPDISRALPYGLLGPIDYTRDRQSAQ